MPLEKRKAKDEEFEYLLKINNGILLDKDGNFIHDIDYNSDKMHGPNSLSSTNHKKIIKFLETQDLSKLFYLK